MEQEVLARKLEAVRAKRSGYYSEIHCVVKGTTWLRKHCGMKLLRVKLFRVDKSCPVHTQYQTGPADEYICQCPNCTYMETSRFMN